MVHAEGRLMPTSFVIFFLMIIIGVIVVVVVVVVVIIISLIGTHRPHPFVNNS